MHNTWHRVSNKDVKHELNKYFKELSEADARKLFKKGKPVFSINEEGVDSLITLSTDFDGQCMFAVEK